MENWNRLVRFLRGPTFRAAQTLLAVLASSAAVVGIFYGAKSISISTENDRRQTTLGVLKPTREEAVLIALYRLQDAQYSGKPVEEINTERLAIARDLLINTYDSIAIHYQLQTVERCIVKVHVQQALDPVISTLEYFKTPSSSIERIVWLRAELQKLGCPSKWRF